MPHPAIGNAFRLRWTLVTTLGTLVGVVFAFLAAVSFDKHVDVEYGRTGFPMAAFATAAFCLPIALGQAFVLGRETVRRAAWTIAMMAGAIVGVGVFSILYALAYHFGPAFVEAALHIPIQHSAYGHPDTFVVRTMARVIYWLSLGAILGATTGIAQGIFLPRDVIRVPAWAVLSATSLAIATTTGWVIESNIWRVWDQLSHHSGSTDAQALTSVISGFLVIGLVYGALTGYALRRLLRNR